MENMKKRTIVVFALAAVLALFFVAPQVYAQTEGGTNQPSYGYGMGPGMMGPGYGYGMGPGMMGRGYGMGPGMMGPGYGYGYGMGPQYGQPYGRQYQQQKPIDKKEAKALLENYLASARNPNLKLGKIEDKGEAFVGEIVTAKGGALVDKIAIDKNTGWMHPVR
jgi:hypothetical protein